LKLNPWILAAALLVLSGAAALGHQLIWIRLMVDTLGAGTGTFARVTGAFFIGLSLGAWCGSITRPNRPWAAVALAESGVAVACVITLLFATTTPWADAAARIPALSAILPFLLIVPAAFAMGITFPWMIRAAQSTGAGTVMLYSLNTAGAVVGVVFVMTWLLPSAGLTVSAWILIGANLVVALAAGAAGMLGFGGRDEPTGPTLQQNDSDSGKWAALAFGSGFLTLSQEVTLQHQFSQVLINSLFSSAAVLAFVLALLSVAAAIAPVIARFLSGPQKALPWAVAAAVVGTCLQPILLVAGRGGVNFLPYQLPLPEYLWSFVSAATMSSAAAVFFSGLIFPLAMQAAGGSPRSAGRLLAWNGLGGLLGAELTSLVLAPAFGLWQMMVFCGCGYLVIAVMFFHPPRLAVIVLAGIVAASAWIVASLPIAALIGDEEILAAQVAPEGVVAVVRRGEDDVRILFNNTYSLGGSKAQVNQERQALLPLLLHGNPQSVATLGVATGSTVAGAALVPGVTRIAAIELSPTVARFARKHFGKYNRRVFEDPRVELILGDARRLIAGSPERYDVIIGDLFLPWRTGEGRMFSKEHFENIRTALRPDGIFCQWLPLFQLTETQFEVILRTFQSVYPDAFLIRGDLYRSQPIIGMVGGRRLADISWNSVAKLTAALREAGETTDPLVRREEGVRFLIAGEPLPNREGPINTLSNAWLEWDAGRNIIGLQRPWFVGDLLENYLEAIQPGHSRAPLPPQILEDTEADWTTWPGRR